MDYPKNFLHGYHDLTYCCLVAAVVGVAAHLGYFIHGWRDPKALHIIVSHLLAGFALFVTTVSMSGFLHGIRNSVLVSSSYLASLFLSILVYRLFFHPLCRFPGPFAAKATKLYSLWMCRNEKQHEEAFALHQKYGDFVRTGKAQRCFCP